jgi:hypothetical protein
MKRRPADYLHWLHVLPLDVGLSLGIICLLLIVSAAQLKAGQDKAQLSAAFSIASDARVNVIEEFAVRGEFIEPKLPLGPMSPGGGDFAYRYVGGRIDASGVLGRGGPEFRLSLTPTTMASGDGWTVIWSCGHRSAPPGWTRQEPSFADNLQASLPYICRDLPVH